MDLEMTEKYGPKYFYQFRIIIIGDSTVGKSSLLRQFTEGQFIQSSDPTVGVDFHVRLVQLSGEFMSRHHICINRPRLGPSLLVFLLFSTRLSSSLGE